MPKFACVCGYVMNLSNHEDNSQFSLVPESRIEEIGEKLARDKTVTEDDFYNLIDEVGLDVLRCPQCKCLHVRDEGSRAYTAYYTTSEK